MFSLYFVGAVGGEGGDEDDKEKEEEAERERQEAIREAEERRKEKHRKMEEEREKMRQEIRDKVSNNDFAFAFLFKKHIPIHTATTALVPLMLCPVCSAIELIVVPRVQSINTRGSLLHYNIKKREEVQEMPQEEPNPLMRKKKTPEELAAEAEAEDEDEFTSM
ncbi:Complexin-2 [Trachymyrmex cornetzi]|uniref:Complexin-2 n=1 Tax=Trachymyrmex cornetzi TaxID=471704 RepID=A0A151J347_9HYME|nr:Complexin-2 [Trachymyrmex cornetzi]